MEEGVLGPIAAWESFYVIVGSSAAALTGLQFVVIRRARRQTGYRPVLEDWIWQTMLPLLAYGALLITALLLHRHPQGSLFVIAAAAVLLLYIGIHNSWDTVTYIAVQQRRAKQGRQHAPPL